ncbi:MAG TPA: SMC-Scp complex subunit ScpB [Bryobacteraceae bacterium]|nr:SMC-Scp complex subunit ScpB [Bryobacteraceae bacterium]
MNDPEVVEISAEELLGSDPGAEPAVEAITMEDAKLKAVLEAIIYVTDEPLSLEQICVAIEQPHERVVVLLEQLTADYEQPERGLSIREVAGGFKMTTKPEHHEAVRRFVKNLNPPLKLSLPALETLAVIAYKQPVTAPEIMEIRGVQGAGVLKTLLDRKLIGTAGRKQVVGKPILYKTTREFLVQFGLKDLAELPSLKEFQELARFDTGNSEAPPIAPEAITQEAIAEEPIAAQETSADNPPAAAPEHSPELPPESAPEPE